MPAVVNPLATLPEAKVLPLDVVDEIVVAFEPFVARAGEIAREAEQVVVTDAAQTAAIKKSGELRRRMKTERVAADKVRKELKEKYLRPGQYIDAASRHFLSLIDPVERRLEEQEQFAARQEQERRRKLYEVRSELVLSLGGDPAIYALIDMTSDQFVALQSSLTAARDQRKAEADRLAKEQEDADKTKREESARLAAENEKLRKQNEKAAADKRVALAKQQAEHDLREAAERKKREVAEAEARKLRIAKEAAEEKIRVARAKEAAEKEADRKAAAKAAKAPDKAKLLAYAKSIRELPDPKMASEDGVDLVQSMRHSLNEIAETIEKEAKEY